MDTADTAPARSDFVRDMISEHLESGRHKHVVTRFPPHPNGYLHIGHAKSICLNFGVAEQFGGRCHLRFDDTNPAKENPEFVASIQRDVKWLGFDWNDHLYHTSDYFGRLYDLAVKLIKDGKAYVCDLTVDEIRTGRGSLSEAGTDSPYRKRSIDENLARFDRMKKGEFAAGACTLRARIDMSNPNMKMRDPPMYRIMHVPHHRQGDDWCLYPLYDWAHGLSDSFEGVTHSLCTLEFENNRELYDWYIEATDVECQPKQTEFARLRLTYTILSKRRLIELVTDGHVAGWDDPRMPTIAGYRRRGVPAQAVRHFCDLVGVSKHNSTVEIGLMEHAIREVLNQTAPRVMCVMEPLKVVISSWTGGDVEWIDAPYFPHDVALDGSRKVPFSREVYIEQGDFSETPPKGWRRLTVGGRVRLRYGHIIECTEVVKDAEGRIVELHCTHETEAEAAASDKAKIAGTIHWVSVEHALKADVRIYDRLFRVEDPSGLDEPLTELNPKSLVVMDQAVIEPSLAGSEPGARFQFERQGYFCVDPVEGGLHFNRIVALKDSWSTSKTPARPARAKAPEQPVVRTISASPEEIVSSDPVLSGLLTAALTVHNDSAGLISYLANELPATLKEQAADDIERAGTSIGGLVKLVADGTISGRTAKDVLVESIDCGTSPDTIVDRDGLRQLSNTDALEDAVDRVIAANPDESARVRGGESKLLRFFIGRVMAETKGRANPAAVSEILRRKLQ
ncbi:MAG: glutaminyl-tRNA synthetase [Myxococcota bacterium]|jgi:glutaminyl-tRNA synthetase